MSVEILGRLFEWDTDKALSNLKKHGVDFDDAAMVFGDPNRIEEFDALHSVDEDRYVTIGMVNTILFVVFTERDDKTRLISARKATAREKRRYYDNPKVHQI